MKRLTFFYDEGMLLHSNGPDHPESAERLRKLTTRLRRLDNARLRWATATEATRESVLRAHDAGYVDWFLSQRGLSGRVDGDTSYNSGTVHAAMLSAGSAIQAVDEVLDHEGAVGWALGRPPGHHAERDRAMGFCFLNNAAIAALHAIEARGLQRVMIIDWDVHHGNGTQDIFWNDARVFYFSSHQYPLFPGTGGARELGGENAVGLTVNLPLPAHTTGRDLQYLYRAFLPSIMAAYAPELVIVSAGFDAHIEDPLASLEATNEDFAAMTRIVLEAADAVCQGRVAFVLEGGYHLSALSNAVMACTQEILGETRHAGDPSGPIGLKVLQAAHGIFAPYWPIPKDL